MDSTIKTEKIFPPYRKNVFGHYPVTKLKDNDILSPRSRHTNKINKNDSPRKENNPKPKPPHDNNKDNLLLNEVNEKHKMLNNNVKFWIEDPSILFQTFEIIPHDDMSISERLNAMSRVIIIIALGLFMLKFEGWWILLLLGLMIIIIIWYVLKDRETQISINQRSYIRKPHRQIIQPINTKRESTNIYNFQLKIIPRP